MLMIQHYREGKPTSSWTVVKPDDGRTALEAAADNDREADTYCYDLEVEELEAALASDRSYEEGRCDE